MEHTLALIEMAHQGDKKARDTLIEENMGLVYSIARRFSGRGVEMEDLFQIGSIGLIKAVDKFDVSFQVRFSTYAVPMIAGEIRRFLRDDGMLKVSRNLKEIVGKAYYVRERILRETGREPAVEEIAAELGILVEELVMAMESDVSVESLSQIVYQGDGNDISLMDRIGGKENHSEKIVDRLFLAEMLGSLKGQERELLYKRYFKDETQTAIAHEMGISQVQVSRMEKRILRGIREKLQADDTE